MINNMATCWRMQLSSGKILCFTDSDQDLLFKGELYHAGNHFTPHSITSSNELSKDDFTISGIIEGEFITKEGLIVGDFSEGYLEVFIIKGGKETILKTGWIGEIKYSNNHFTASVNSLSTKTNNLIGKCYSASCRAEFADFYCKIDKSKYSFDGIVTALGEECSFIDLTRNEPDDYFSQGVLEFISGENSGRKYNISSFQENKITIEAVINPKISIGDKYKITAGCNKSLYACINKFSNAVNFRGEPFIPNQHKLLARN